MKKIIKKISFIFIATLTCAHGDQYYKRNKHNNDSFDYFKQPMSGQNGSFYGEMNKNHRHKNEYVNSYQHKDGSRVKSYYRNRKGK